MGRVSRSRVRFPSRKRITHAAESSWDSTVARAAPDTPMSSRKMKMGSSTILAAAPMRVVTIPTRPKPWALMKPFIPVPTMARGVPMR